MQIWTWHKKIQRGGWLCWAKGPGRQQTPEETVERIRQELLLSLKESVRITSLETQIPPTTVWRPEETLADETLQAAARSGHNGRWQGKAQTILIWPPRSPDMTPCDFFLWGDVKGMVYVPLLSTHPEELKQRITTALEIAAQDMLLRVWEELDYRLDVVPCLRLC